VYENFAGCTNAVPGQPSNAFIALAPCINELSLNANNYTFAVEWFEEAGRVSTTLLMTSGSTVRTVDASCTHCLPLTLAYDQLGQGLYWVAVGQGQFANLTGIHGGKTVASLPDAYNLTAPTWIYQGVFKGYRGVVRQGDPYDILQCYSNVTRLVFNYRSRVRRFRPSIPGRPYYSCA
jgi:hypothetical protein